MKITVDYVRISKDKRGQEAGVQSQHRDNAALADEFGLTIAETFSDNDRSAKARDDGTSAPRPDYERLLDGIRAGTVGTVIVWHADRLHRNVDEASRFVALARKYDVRLYSVGRGGEYRLTKAAGKSALLKDTVTAQEESEHRGERVTLARQRQSRNGEYGGGSRRPYGWGVDTGRTRRVCLNPKDSPELRRYEDRPVLDMTRHNGVEAAEIQRWARDLLSGVAMRQVLRDLAARDVATVTGSTWDSKTITQILTSPRTSGHSEYRGEIVKRNALPEILPEDTRLALITLFADPRRKTSPGNVPKWLGSLVYICGRCDDGTTMTVRRANGGEVVYRCRERGHCQRKQDDVDAFVKAAVVARLSRADVADLLPAQSTVDVAALREELITLDARKLDAAQRFAVGSIDGPMMDTITVIVDKRRAEIHADLSGATAESPLAEFVGTDDAAATFEALTLGRKREILRLLATVTLMPTARGTRTFRPESIRWEWNA